MRHAVAAPDACTLVQIAPDGKENRIAMPTLKEGGYGATFTPVADFRYRVETGPDASPTYAMETIQPVDLAADSPEITTKPPVYAENTVDADIVDGLVDVTVLQHGTVRFDCKFTRPAASAFLEWTPTEVKPETITVETTPVEMTLSPDHTTAAVILPAAASGKYSLQLRAERGVPTDFPSRDLIVKEDKAPEFKKVVAKEELKAVLPYDHVPLEFTAADDVAVGVRRSGVSRQPGRSSPRAGRHDWPQTARGFDASERTKVRSPWPAKCGRATCWNTACESATILPPEFGGPHTVYYPVDHSLMLRVATDKEILAFRDEINKRLDKIKEDIKKEEADVAKERKESADHAALNPEQAKQAEQLKKDNKDTENELQDLAKSAETAPPFQALADLAKDVADKEMKASEKLPTRPPPTTRPPPNATPSSRTPKRILIRPWLAWKR